jgi:ATP-binding cassette, subfamily B, bacterial PglK
MKILNKILFLLKNKEKQQGLLVLFLAVIMAVFETVGVVSLVPFLSVLGNPEVVKTNPLLAYAYEILGFESVDIFLFVLGTLAFFAIIFSSGFRVLSHYIMNRFIEMRRYSISALLMETYLHQPYAFFLNRSSHDLGKNILSEVDVLIDNVFRPFMMMIAYSVVVFFLVFLLLIMDPLLSVSAAILISGLYLLIYLGVRGKLKRSGQERTIANHERFTTAGEALGGIKFIKLLGHESFYLSRFKCSSICLAKNLSALQTLSMVPKFVIEAIAFGGIIALILILITIQGGVTEGSFGEILPMLGVFAFASYKLLPSVQNIYNGLAKLRFGIVVLDRIVEDLSKCENFTQIYVRQSEPLIPKDKIALQEISYTYPYASEPALIAINITIPVGSSLGIVGSTGSGKTTLVDVLIGLLRPTKGKITVDGEPIIDNKNLREWQRALGYVPQDIFLTDSTVYENIALGVPLEKIDRDQIKRCAQMAQMHDFITQELPEGYSTLVGERGVRLSGGQRQRIGIARALYHNPEVLVFDEATSSLDNVTEKAFMNAIDSLSRQKTIIMIAHRLSTVQSCDKIVFIEHGRVISTGSFEELIVKNDFFREMSLAKTDSK